MEPNKNLVNITTFYIEEVKKTGNSVFHFVESPEQMSDWKTRGYSTRVELAEMKKNGNLFLYVAEFLNAPDVVANRDVYKGYAYPAYIIGQRAPFPAVVLSGKEATGVTLAHEIGHVILDTGHDYGLSGD